MTRLGLVGDQKPRDVQPRNDAPANLETGHETNDEREIRISLTRLAGTLSAHGEVLLSADLALDLLLNRLAEQARLATNTTGAAIALRRGDEIVCRATTGANAPDLGVRLDEESGLSGACVQTREVQSCDDTETDLRVNTMVCRQLGIRSILIVPVLKEQELLGVFEVFSPQPYAFGDRDVQTLHALSQRAVDSIMRSAEAVSPRRAKPIVETVPANVPVPVPAVAAGARRRDPWTSALTVVVVLLAVLLGWILGHDGWKRTVRSMKTKTAPAKTYPQPERLNDIPAASDDETAPAVRRNAANPAPGNLVVYQNGKIIYGANSPQAPAEAPQIVLPPEVAEQSLKQRIEPVYPDAAREQRIQGQVLLAATIGKDGTVQELQVLSGDPQLAIAAGDAVRQWHFRPLIKAGKPSGFQTQITMDFRLPNL